MTNDWTKVLSDKQLKQLLNQDYYLPRTMKEEIENEITLREGKVRCPKCGSFEVDLLWDGTMRFTDVNLQDDKNIRAAGPVEFETGHDIWLECEKGHTFNTSLTVVPLVNFAVKIGKR